MSSPVGGSLPPPPLPPVVVINVPSPTVFGLLRGMVDVIHATHVHVNYHQANQTGLSGRGSRPVIVVYSNPADQTDADVTIESTGPGTKPSEPSTDSPKLNLPGTSAHPPKEGEPERRRVELPPGFEVPDLTDHSPARSIEEKLKYQRMVREYIERIARIVKEMSISKEINKREIVEAAESARESRGVEQPVSKQKSEKGSAGAPNSPAEVDAAEEEDVHHIDLIIETVAEDGRIEQIPVERCEIADLVENLEDILGHEIAPDQTQPQAAEASPKEKPAKGGKEPSPTAMNKTGVGGKVLGKASPQSLTDPAGKAGGLQPLASSTPVIGAAAVASYMPYAGQTPGRQEKAAAGDGFKVEQIEGEEAASRFGSDNMERREAGKVPGEGAAAAKVSRKSARQTSVQGVADTAAKEQRAKKTQTQRLDDERIIPVHGKFSVDQLKGVRRRRGKGEAAGSVGGAETHRLIDILYMVMCAVICGSETIFDITAFIESREKWFTTVLGLRNGLPGTSLISKLLVSFNASQLSDMLQIWMREALGAPAKSGLASIVISEIPEGILFAQEKAAAGSTAEQCLDRKSVV